MRFKSVTAFAALALSLTVSASALATSGGNGSGNPRNTGDSEFKSTQEPLYIWVDSKLVKNPARE